MSAEWIRRLAIIVFLLVFSALSPACHTAPAAQTPAVRAAALRDFDPGPVSEAFLARAQEYLEYCVASSGGNTFTQIARMELDEGPIHEQGVRDDLAFINERNDCSDFRMQALIRVLYQYAESPLLPAALLEEIRQTVLDFKYWIDEPGVDGMCYWSENHQILFHTSEYLMGQLFPDEIFSNNGMTGAEHAAKALPMVLDWLAWRARVGFSEWHSNVYYDEDMAPLVNLVDFAADDEVATRAAMVLDLLCFDIALNSHYGTFGTTHGRSYENDKKGGRGENTASASRLLFGEGIYNSRSSMSAVSLATSRRYHMPPVLEAIGGDHPEVLLDRERMSIDPADAAHYGLDYDDFESGMFFWGMGAYAHWRLIETTIRMAEEYNLWEGFFAPFEIAKYLLPFGILPALTRTFWPFGDGGMMSEVNSYTFRTPDYMLSCAQDWDPGLWGAQQHAWQATLDIDAVVWTTYPGGMPDDYMAGNWTGGFMPRAAQHENVLIAVYQFQPPTLPFVKMFPPYTHAYFPRAAFDEVVDCDHWVFGRKGDAYVALYSSTPPCWTTEGEEADQELVAHNRSNVWICEMGRQATDGPFEDFTGRILSAPVYVLGLKVFYQSPSQGWISFGWDGPFRVEGAIVELHDYPRYDNPYCNAPFESDTYLIEKEDLSLFLDFLAGERHIVE